MGAKKIQEKQKRFIDYLIELGNIERAAIKAGYSKNYAKGRVHYLLGVDRVRAYYEKRLKEVESDRIMQPAEVLQYLTSVARGQSQAEIVVVEGVGDGVSQAKHVKKAPDEKERLKAAELLGKRYRMFTDNLNLDGGFQINFHGEEKIQD
jgi:phage terminase small subunit